MVASISSPIDTLLQGATRARAPGRTCTVVPTLPCKPNSRCDLRETKLAPNTRWGSRSRDPVGYEGSPYSLFEYVASMPLTLNDPSGMVSGTLHHGYPLYLGGLQSQPLWSLGSCQLHQAAHNYLASQGFGFGDAGRAAWGRLTLEQQAHHIRQALTAGGVPSHLIDQHIDDVMRGANPGVRTPRVGPCGPRICWSVGFSALFIVLTNPGTCHAAEPSPYIGCERCSCRTFADVEIIPSWWNLRGTPSTQGRIWLTPWIDIGAMGHAECLAAGTSNIIEVQHVIGYTIIRYEETKCEPR